MSCDVVDANDIARFHRDYYLHNKPAIIRGMNRLHPCKVFDWSARTLASQMGDKRVPVVATRSGYLSYERNMIDMAFNDFVERMSGPDAAGLRYYFKNPTRMLPSDEDATDCLKELEPYLGKAFAKNLWISGSGLTVGLHFDPAENLNFQLKGHKRFTLYPPGIRRFYPLGRFSQTAHISRVFRDGPSPDLRKYPRFDPSRGLDVELKEGDVLYLPTYWWHQVESMGPENLNLNFWWMPKVRKQVKHPDQALRGYAQMGIRLIKFGHVQGASPDKKG